MSRFPESFNGEEEKQEPELVDSVIGEARIYEGRISYHAHGHEAFYEAEKIITEEVCFVEIDRLPEEGADPLKNYLSTHDIAIGLGFKDKMALWQKKPTDKNSIFITGGYDDDGSPISLSREVAEEIVKKINDARGSRLGEYLVAFGIDFEKYGTGSYKTLEDLYREIMSGSSLLVEEGEKLLRVVDTATIYVYYIDESQKTFLLKEDRQEFKDGRSRVRNYPWSIAEKKEVSDKNILETAKRGFAEEIGLKIEKDENLKCCGSNKNLEESKSFPGIETQYNNNLFQIFLTEDQYKEEGYIEEQIDKTNYFVWREV